MARKKLKLPKEIDVGKGPPVQTLDDPPGSGGQPPPPQPTPPGVGGGG